MTIFEIWLVAISLAIDCLSVSITSGAILKEIRWKTFVTMAFFFGLFQSLMPLLGWMGANSLNEYIQDYDHWIAFGLLIIVGGNMIKENFSKEEERHFNPSNLKTIILLAIATSIDAMAVGITFAFTGMNTLTSIVFPILIFGLVSFILSIAGSMIGVFCGKRWNLNMELWGGIVLICIGIKILVEHLHLFDL
ncbi:MAG: manganese efflux pump MntP [Phocaeicola sp.]|uniref:manganese efflux pump MntP n=1 Tax=Phocaeicola TaxID=909656 RepID=UPI00234EA23A|nr:manganese efflux pump MntP family protein [Phocaeicola oris]MCE2615658.1 manganese efflux pump MntP family protein [Phocaeicola oris]